MGKHTLNREACKLCARCVEHCPSGALEMIGKKVTAKEVVNDVLRDRKYFKTSGGGVTISGGEPMMQPEFTFALLNLFEQEGISRALETCGYARYSDYEKVLPLVDLFLFDYKETDKVLHKKFTGVDNTRILENLSKLDAAGAKILLRCPVIHGLNDREDHFKGIAETAKQLKNLVGVEILAYHKLGVSKVNRMGLDEQEEFEVVPTDVANRWRDAVRSYGVEVMEA